MYGCTDGVCLLDGVRYFDCPPNKGYFCLLEQLVPDQRFMASNKDLIQKNRELFLFAICHQHPPPPTPTPPPPPQLFAVLLVSFEPFRLYARELDLHIQDKNQKWLKLMPLSLIYVEQP